MSSLDPLRRPDCHLSAGCPPGDVCPLSTRRSLGRLTDVLDLCVWPVVTTFASLLPRRIGRLIRADNPHLELDPIA